MECRVVAVASSARLSSAATAAPGSAAGRASAVGAALALRGSGRLPVAVCGDGDFLMGATALWTAVHYNIPLLVVVANNRSFFNDELHQERVARMRNRPVENRWIGQRIADPEIDLAQLARAQGALGFGPITDGADLAATFSDAIEAVAGAPSPWSDVRVAQVMRRPRSPDCSARDGLLVRVVSPCARRTLAWLSDVIAATPGLRQGLIFTPSNTSDPYLDDGRRRSLRCSSTSMTSRRWKRHWRPMATCNGSVRWRSTAPRSRRCWCGVTPCRIRFPHTAWRTALHLPRRL